MKHYRTAARFYAIGFVILAIIIAFSVLIQYLSLGYTEITNLDTVINHLFVGAVPFGFIAFAFHQTFK